MYLSVSRSPSVKTEGSIFVPTCLVVDQFLQCVYKSCHVCPYVHISWYIMICYDLIISIMIYGSLVIFRMTRLAAPAPKEPSTSTANAPRVDALTLRRAALLLGIAPRKLRKVTFALVLAKIASGFGSLLWKIAPICTIYFYVYTYIYIYIK